MYIVTTQVIEQKKTLYKIYIRELDGVSKYKVFILYTLG